MFNLDGRSMVSKPFASIFLLPFLLASFCLILVASLIFPSFATGASFADVDVDVDVPAALSLTVDRSAVNLSVVPIPTGASASSLVSVLISTNNKTGYGLTMNTQQATVGTNSEPGNSLLHVNDINIVPSTGNVSSGALGVNTWGYNLLDSASDFLAIPMPSSAAAAIKNRSAPVTDDETRVTFGANVNTNLVAGTYTNTMVFTATTNYVPIPPEIFRFTIDTRLDMGGNIDPTGGGTEFYIPTSGYVGGDVYDSGVGGNVSPSHQYDWMINCGKSGEVDWNATGTSNWDTYAGIRCEYDNPGVYQVTIKSNGPPTAGWMNAFGQTWNDTHISLYYVRSIDAPVTNLMRTPGVPYRFAHMFMFWPNLQDIPSNLFRRVSTTGHTDLSGMFQYTFMESSTNSAVATIPAGLFSSLDTSSATDLNNMFYATFGVYAANSSVANIPSGLFSSFDISGAVDLSSMFDSAFAEFAANSSVANIPSGLFSSFDTSGASDLSNMFAYTFSRYAENSPVANIPSGLFSSINTSGASNLSAMFGYTFSGYATSSSAGTIPSGLFSSIDTSSATNLGSMFAYTFRDYATVNVFDGVSDTNINNIWGAADLSGITAANAGSALSNTFVGMPSLMGDASTFINTKWPPSGMIPNDGADTFNGTHVTNVPHANWGTPLP